MIHSASRFAFGALALVAAVSFVGIPDSAIAQASAYVPLDDIAYNYVDALMARGQLRELSALERPFTEMALRVAVDSARIRGPSTIISSYLDALYHAAEKYAVRPGNSDTSLAQTFRARGTVDVYATAQTSGRRELMLADSTSDVRPGGSIRLVMAGGPVVGFTRASCAGGRASAGTGTAGPRPGPAKEASGRWRRTRSASHAGRATGD